MERRPENAGTGGKVIDAALKYGFDSPDSLQSVNTQIWSEWLPAPKGYKLAGNYSLEVYGPPAEDPEEYVSYIWVP